MTGLPDLQSSIQDLKSSLKGEAFTAKDAGFSEAAALFNKAVKLQPQSGMMLKKIYSNMRNGLAVFQRLWNHLLFRADMLILLGLMARSRLPRLLVAT